LKNWPRIDRGLKAYAEGVPFAKVFPPKENKNGK